MRKAKIISTIGPACDSVEMLDRLIEHGMDAARLNFSHGTHDLHAAAIAAIREAASRRHTPIAIIQDLQGPRLRVGDLPAEGLDLLAGQTVHLRTGGSAQARSSGSSPSGQSGPMVIPVSYRALTQDVSPGARILINDGLIELVARQITGDTVECAVITGGRVTSHKGINLPGTRVSAQTLGEKDRQDIQFGVAQHVDYIALSFVRGPEDINAARQVIKDCGGRQPIIAKIERAEALSALDAILDAADGVMIARGDLGVEMGPEFVPMLQKRIIAEANRRRRLVITATQMLESMTQQPRPTRAEASDVANAVLDGTDAVMLSAETAVGAHVIASVQVMDRIIRAAEADQELDRKARPDHDRDTESIPEAICTAAFYAVSSIRARAIVAFSELGRTALLMSKQRPTAPIVAFTPHEAIKRQLALYWGVTPRVMMPIDQTDTRVDEAVRRLKGEGFVKTGERVVILSGSSIGRPGGTDLVKLQEVD